mmetsp:Transcript_47059/g.93684  ORF Transcript_47059/g.93684 Transcript_47059/m.93684 type:complete len:265 (+) Transcript_47059:78-872(+)
MPNFSFEIEYAKSNRSACKKCRGKIDKDLVRIGFKIEAPEDAEGAAAHMGCSWHHFGCFPQAKGQVWFKRHLTNEAVDSIVGLNALKSEDREAVAELFKACRGEAPVPTAVPNLVTGASVAVDTETPTKEPRKRKQMCDTADGSMDGPAKVPKGVLTEEQAAAIAEAKTKLSSKNAAFLSAALERNGLPKTGRKDELLDRVAENSVLGVPPVCDVCEKRRLSWARSTGQFSCPGYFDDEAKHFKRCKGPSGTEQQRTQWQEMVV